MIAVSGSSWSLAQDPVVLWFDGPTEITEGRYDGKGQPITVQGTREAVVRVAPGTVMTDYKISLDGGELAAEAVHLKEVEIIVGQAKVSIWDSVVENCRFRANQDKPIDGSAVSTADAVFELKNCVVTKQLIGGHSEDEIYAGVQDLRLTGCTFYNIDLPPIFYSKDPSKEAKADDRTILRCKFVNCRVPQSFLIATEGCVFENCYIGVARDFEGLTEPLEVTIAVVNPRGKVPTSEALVTYTVAEGEVKAGSTLPHEFRTNELTSIGLELSKTDAGRELAYVHEKQAPVPVPASTEPEPTAPPTVKEAPTDTRQGTTITAKGVEGSATIPLNRKQARVKGLLVSEVGFANYAGMATQMSALVLPGDPSKPLEVTFNQPVGESMGISLGEVVKFLQFTHDGWPRGGVADISFEDKYSSKDGPSAAVACALLLDSLITGNEINEHFAVTGDMNADGSVQPIGGVGAKIRGAAKRDCDIVAIPSKNADDLRDLLIRDGVGPLIRTQVFSIETFDEARELAVVERSEALTRSMEEFERVIEVFTRKGADEVALLKNAKMQEKLQLIVDGAPRHLSARLLLDRGQGRIPSVLSLNSSIIGIEENSPLYFREIRSASGESVASAPAFSSRSYMEELERLRAMRPKLDPRTWPYADATINFMAASKRPFTDPPTTTVKLPNGQTLVRPKPSESPSSRAQAVLLSERAKLMKDPEIIEDLLR